MTKATMAEVIYGTLRTYEVGKLYQGLRKENGQLFHEQPFYVLREATYQEWLAFAAEEGMVPSPQMLKAAQSKAAKFYAISTD
jgi:hypothetical protein